MPKDETTGNPEAPAQDSGVEETNFSAEDWIKARTVETQEPEEKPEPEGEPDQDNPEGVIGEEVSEPEKKPEGEPESEEPEGDEDVLSQIDFDALTDEQRIAVAEKVGSGAGKEIGKLRGKLREAEAKLQELSETPPAVRAPSNNPYGNIDKVEDLQKTAAELEKTVDWAEEQLLDAGQYSADDVMFEQGGQKYTKRDIHRMLKEGRQALTKHIPEQAQYLQKLSAIPQQREKLLEKAKSELEYFGQEDSPLKQKFEAMLADPRFSVLEKAAPELHAQLPYIFAHAVPSLFGERKPKTGIKLPLKSKPKPISTPDNSGAAPSNPRESKTKAMDSIKKRFQSGEGGMEDFIRLRVAQTSEDT